MDTALGVAVAITVTLGLTAPLAHADDTLQFASPSGNIRCIIFGPNTAPPGVHCQIKDFTYSVPPGTAKDQNGANCPTGSDGASDFRLDQGGSAYLTCSYSALGSGFGDWQPVDFGQTKSLGSITCESEADGMTCTDIGTGRFFRVSRDSYQLG